MSSAFFAVGLIIAAASVLGAVARNFKQPLILAYILVGVLAASFGIFQEGELRGTLDFLAELGIAFLLFLIGLELKINDVRHLGKIALITGLGQVIFTSVVGFIISRFLGFGNLEALYIAIALTFSSTIIIVKLLSEKRDLDSLYGKIAVGFLLVQDVVAILALIVIASVGTEQFSASTFALTFVEGALFVAITFWLSRYAAPSIFNAVAKNVELLFLSSIAWAMIFGAASAALGFSMEIGAFLAGVGLATLKEEHQIAARIRPLRDLFIVIFFISLGLKLSFGNILSSLQPAVILSLFVLVGNPLIMLILMGILGFRKRTSFLVSVATAQISEFSLVLVVLGLRAGHLTTEVVSLVTLVGIITIGTSSYLILNSTRIYKKLSRYLSIFQRKVLLEKVLETEKEFSDHVVLIGAGRLGSEILKSLQNSGKEVVVVEFDPNIVRRLIDEGVDVLFGDVNDKEIFEKANLAGAKLVVSTIFDPDNTQELLELLKEQNVRLPIVVTAAETGSALKFYQKGADYVIIPRILSSYHVALLLDDSHIGQLISGRLRERHLKELREKNNLIAS